MNNSMHVHLTVFNILLITAVAIVIVANRTPEPIPNDLNNDGEVNFTDFSVALAQLNGVMEALKADCPECNFHQPANVIEDVYPPVPLPYQETPNS